MEEIYTVICGPHRVRTTVTDKPSVVRKWVHYTRYRRSYQRHQGRLVVGLGVQWVPNMNYAATLQLCTGYNCLIFQLNRADHFPAVLRRFLVDPDDSMLMESRHDVEVGPLVDLRVVASDLRGCSRMASMGTLAEEILGLHDMHKDMWVGRSNWEDYYLSKEQVKYACHDVFIAFLIAKELRVWNWVERRRRSAGFGFRFRLMTGRVCLWVFVSSF